MLCLVDRITPRQPEIRIRLLCLVARAKKKSSKILVLASFVKSRAKAPAGIRSGAGTRILLRNRKHARLHEDRAKNI
jgi:hypothetical protein